MGEAAHGVGGGGASKQHLGPDTHLEVCGKAPKRTHKANKFARTAPKNLLNNSRGLPGRYPIKQVRADFREGEEDSNFSIFRVRRFSEWPEPLH